MSSVSQYASSVFVARRDGGGDVDGRTRPRRGVKLAHVVGIVRHEVDLAVGAQHASLVLVVRRDGGGDVDERAVLAPADGPG